VLKLSFANERITGIDLIADPAQLQRFDLATLES